MRTSRRSSGCYRSKRRLDVRRRRRCSTSPVSSYDVQQHDQRDGKNRRGEPEPAAQTDSRQALSKRWPPTLIGPWGHREWQTPRIAAKSRRETLKGREESPFVGLLQVEAA